jgi:hypothetical protein
MKTSCCNRCNSLEDRRNGNWANAARYRRQILHILKGVRINIACDPVSSLRRAKTDIDDNSTVPWQLSSSQNSRLANARDDTLSYSDSSEIVPSVDFDSRNELLPKSAAERASNVSPCACDRYESRLGQEAAQNSYARFCSGRDCEPATYARVAVEILLSRHISLYHALKHGRD